MPSVVTQIINNIRTAIEGITGMGDVHKAAEGVDLSELVGGSDFPVAFLMLSKGEKQDSALVRNQPMTYRVTTFDVLVLDSGRPAGDEDWPAERAEELEAQVVAAVMADHTRGALARVTEWADTTYNPATDGEQIDASVQVSFEVTHRHKANNLEDHTP